MNVFIGQIYSEPGVNYLFSHLFQKWLGQEITDRVQPSSKWISTYGPDFSLMLRVSAKSSLIVPEIKGPTVFRRDKDVEVTIFLPHDGMEVSEGFDSRKPLKFLFSGIADALKLCDLDPKIVESDTEDLIDRAAQDPTMIFAIKATASTSGGKKS